MFGKLSEYIIFIASCLSIAHTYPHSRYKREIFTYKNYSCNVTIHREKRSVAIKGQQWRDKVIPYTMAPEFNQTQQQMIINTMRILEHNVSNIIQFRPSTSEDQIFLRIQSGQGCSASLGQQVQSVMTLHEDCFSTRTLLHELMHVLGFGHEQKRPDRDEYVCVFENNILEGEEVQFSKYSPEHTETFGLPYDYSSIMHYSYSLFNKDPDVPNILPIKNTSVEIGQTDKLSLTDVQAVLRYYENIPKENSSMFYDSDSHLNVLPLILVASIFVALLYCIFEILDFYWLAPIKRRRLGKNEITDGDKPNDSL